MEPNGLGGGGIFPNINGGFLGVENPLKQQQQQQQQQQNLHHSQMVSYSTPHHETDTHPSQHSIKHGYPPYSSKTNKPQSITTLSDEDEPAFTADEDTKRKGSPWHRMKWTDTMVRLLIMAVYYIGDEAGSEILGTDPTGSKKKATGLLIQKKGKWKSVSRGMMEKGYYVSPQQCEDKFNDLNKRYKRVNDILGKGTACKVVENHSLMDSMDLSSKMKEEAKKLLNSKHLFFREMCAYHSSCGHGSSVGGSGNSSEPQQQQQQPQQQQQKCLHNGVGSLGMIKGRSVEEEEDEDEEDEWEEYSEEEEEDYSSKGEDENDNNNNNNVVRKRTRNNYKVMMQQLSSEVNDVLQDGVKSGWEKKQWMKKRVVQLSEEQVSYQVEGFELEKQRLKWVRFSSNKEREMERQKLENERKRLEIEKMVLLLRQKELELLNTQHQHQHQHSST